MRKKISAVYKITNTITGDFYIGSSKDVKQRLAAHKCHSRWKNHPNNPMYKDFQKYGLDKFDFEILTEVEIEHLKEKEQWLIEKMHPTYNSNNAKGWDIERYKKEYDKEYYKEYRNQLCYYDGKKLTLHALYSRFRKAGIEHPIKEAKKYLVL